MNSPVSALEQGNDLDVELVPGCYVASAHCSSGMGEMQKINFTVHCTCDNKLFIVLLSDCPRTHVTAVHNMNVGCATPLKQHLHRLATSLLEILRKELLNCCSNLTMCIKQRAAHHISLWNLAWTWVLDELRNLDELQWTKDPQVSHLCMNFITFYPWYHQVKQTSHCSFSQIINK